MVLKESSSLALSSPLSKFRKAKSSLTLSTMRYEVPSPAYHEIQAWLILLRDASIRAKISRLRVNLVYHESINCLGVRYIQCSSTAHPQEHFQLPALHLLHSLPNMALNISGAAAIMRGVVYNGVPFEMNVQDLPFPTIGNETDAIVRITTSAICGSDLHIYRGVAGGTPPWIVGHEAIGYISEIGSAVSSLSVGDYVVIPDTANHGHLEMEPETMEYFGNGQAGLPEGLQGKNSSTRTVQIPLQNH